MNKKGKLKCSLIFDELPTIFLNHIDSLIATARSNQVATTLAIQDFSQLRKDYGKDQSDVIMNITGNIISGQVTGDSAKQLSERFGKIMQDRHSISVNRSDTSVSHSHHLDSAIPVSTISTLSAGEFVGMVADDPDEIVKLKIFHNRIVNDHKLLKKQQSSYKPIPDPPMVSPAMIQQKYLSIRKDIEDLVNDEMMRMMNNPAMSHYILRK